MKARRGTKLITSSIPELGFIRISVQRTAGKLLVPDAAKALAGILESLGKHHEFLADDLSPTGPWPAWCAGASQTTDAHLLALANRHGAALATLDTGIPGAFLVPSLSP